MNELPKGWVQTTLADVTKPRGEKADPSTLGDLPFLGMDHIEANTAKLLGSQPANELKSAVAIFKKGDILYGRLRPYLNKVHLAEFDGSASAEFIVFPPSEAIEQRFLQSLLRSHEYRTLADQRSTGDRPRVKFDNVSDFEFWLPPIVEQRRIVKKLDILSARNTTIRTDLTAITKLVGRYRTQVLQTALSGAYTAKWRSENPTPVTSAAQIVAECKETCISVRRSKLPTRNLVSPNSIPPEWGLERGEDLCSVIVDGTHHTPTYKDEGIPFISVKDVRNGKVYFDDCKFISESEHAELAKRCAPMAGDILITKSGTIGRLAVLEKVPVFSLFVSVAMIRPASPKLDPHFLAYALENWVGSINIDAEISGSTIKNLHLQDIKALGVPIPSFEEQREMVRQIETAFAKIDRLAAEIAKAKEHIVRLDESILAKAFTGELVSQDPNDEPACALLDRIRAARANAPKKPRKKPTKAKAMKVAPQERVLIDSAEWPEQGLPFEDIAKRLTLPHDDLKGAVFALLEGDTPKLRQEFDMDAKVMKLVRVAS